ncbi:unnamed protein product [Rhizophagus irregularis]|uniref:Uncharacterized protein n=1 Tax=Rhizophagus irregularis TaxID=588596 RepID=A0A916DX86_9GLOM|nr:unnamed protein product [Rhizophagus irregularis]CAB5305133.1 unnamed protein product [Rhizophagus irregularis]
MELDTSYYNDLDTHKNKNASLLNSITFNKKELTETNMINEINKTNFIYDELLEANGELNTRSKLVLQITEQQNKIANNTFTLTENILNDFGKEYDECLSKLKKILSEVKISLEEFELLFRLKKERNLEFHQDKIKTLDEVKKDLETDFPDDLKEFKNPLKKLINALESW